MRGDLTHMRDNNQDPVTWKSPNNPQNRHSTASSSGGQGECTTRPSRTFTTKGHPQDHESQHLHLLNKNKGTTPKQKEESPQKELNEMELSNLSEIEFRVMATRMLKELRKN